MRQFWGIGLCLIGATLQAQLNHPRASPAQTLIQQIGLCEVEVRYSRPAVRGRVIFGDLVPYGRIWRVGANESTKIRLGCPTEIAGRQVASGTYALYAFPASDQWEVVIHRDTSHWGDGRTAYDPKEDLFRFPVRPMRSGEVVENFTISFDRITHSRMDMIWAWDTTRVVIPMAVATDTAMEKEIAQAIEARPTAQTFYEAARYLQEAQKDLPRALRYVDKALELGGDTYYFHRVRSLILAEMGSYAPAIAAAERSRALAAAQGKDEFVRMNQKNIRKWTAHTEASKN